MSIKYLIFPVIDPVTRWTHYRWWQPCRYTMSKPTRTEFNVSGGINSYGYGRNIESSTACVYGICMFYTYMCICKPCKLYLLHLWSLIPRYTKMYTYRTRRILAVTSTSAWGASSLKPSSSMLVISWGIQPSIGGYWRGNQKMKSRNHVWWIVSCRSYNQSYNWFHIFSYGILWECEPIQVI